MEFNGVSGVKYDKHTKNLEINLEEYNNKEIDFIPDDDQAIHITLVDNKTIDDITFKGKANNVKAIHIYGSKDTNKNSQYRAIRDIRDMGKTFFKNIKENFENLSVIVFHDCTPNLDVLKKLSLQQLMLYHTDVTNEDLSLIPDSITKLYIDGSYNITDVSGLSHLKNLSIIYMNNNKIIAGIDFLTDNLDNLKSFSADNNLITNSQIINLGKNGKTTYISLSGNPISNVKPVMTNLIENNAVGEFELCVDACNIREIDHESYKKNEDNSAMKCDEWAKSISVVYRNNPIKGTKQYDESLDIYNIVSKGLMGLTLQKYNNKFIENVEKYFEEKVDHSKNFRPVYNLVLKCENIFKIAGDFYQCTENEIIPINKEEPVISILSGKTNTQSTKLDIAKTVIDDEVISNTDMLRELAKRELDLTRIDTVLDFGLEIQKK